jgi:hypothetical protein
LSRNWSILSLTRKPQVASLELHHQRNKVNNVPTCLG